MILITGGAGELGSHFAKICVDRGEDVKIIDIVRKNEAWRLKWLNIFDQVKYIWKSTFDFNKKDLYNVRMILDCACQPDRPLGTTSPFYTLSENLFGPTRIAESIIKREKPPLLIYPSSCNVFLGVPIDKQPLTEDTRPMPANYYGWSKLAAEELYRFYQRVYNLPIHIIRTGSAYGPGMRSDQMIAKCIIHLLNNKTFNVKSPNASRTYTYAGDVLDFYQKYLDKVDDLPNNLVLHNGGNKENKAYTTMQVASLIQGLIFDGKNNPLLREDKYEKGEMLDEPVMQWESYEYAKKILGWTPKHTLIEGLKETINWFKNNMELYSI